ncbi:hypothetical protein [Alicyclobacillus ferrooxydans]|uniref:DoxX family protein n=1 Tax=Alicyclobacillus ferrooxydans TaxID=471514 RepID=A0A0P9CL73_9BACL|nr:hypothetical protein [Alicyclobacillus ferrooxydans]KPV43758.1 hypothetical protein AN477_10205 [Alicyclobacillus ferrooxydans]
MISRRVVQTLLGLVWLIDGLLQLKPQMFTSAFLKQVILPTGEGEPHWVTAVVNWGASLTAPHIAMWNTLFALVQILIGLALIVNFKLRSTITASVVWSLTVWVFGEGFGQLFTGQSLLLTGAPGAVLIYALIGVAIWPDSRQKSEWKPGGIRFARFSLAGLFLLGAVLHLQGAYLTGEGLSQAVAWPWLSKVIAMNGTVASLVFAAIELVLSVFLAFRIRIRATVWVSMVLSFLFWWAGQAFGQVFDPLATDFNSGLLMIILAMAAYPHLIDNKELPGLRSRKALV